LFKVEFLGIDYEKSAFVKVPMNVLMTKIDNNYKDIRAAIKLVANELVSMKIIPVDVVSVYDIRTSKMVWQEERGDYYSA